MCKSTDYQSTKERTVLKAVSSNSSSRKRSLRQRRVCFNFFFEDAAAAPSPITEITQEHLTNNWYSKRDIRAFREQAKELVLSGLPSNEETFGLERYKLERSRQKKSTVKYVVLSQKVVKDPGFQRYISRRRTSTSKEAALNQALENFCEVYDPLSSLLEGGFLLGNYNDDCFFANNLAIIHKISHRNEPTRRVRQPSIVVEC
ncbi:unnamed protein product [Cylindrotheca closterium]|uniref:Uncharacterized protein n=1 Tax=Cylindrotheca closterium TaxID=2856 RepID=A0AAD2FPQ6_9STRA|nr:unnamed protein product [Cylindrotheca closterium]